MKLFNGCASINISLWCHIKINEGEIMDKVKWIKIVMNSSLLLVVSCVAGCAMPITPRYAVSASNIVDLREMYGNSPNKIKVGEFTSDITDINCRGGEIQLPDKQTFATFMKSGFTDELKLAGVSSENSSIILSAKILNLDVDCNIGTAHWQAEVELKVGAGTPFIVKNTYDFDGAFAGVVVYSNARESLNNAFQDLFSHIIKDPNFKLAFSGIK
jgi:hypothetical protein